MSTKAIVNNPLKALLDYGQSVWLDYIRRSLITSGELTRMIEDDGLRGITSNPAIFEKAIAGSTDYADILGELQKQNLDAKRIYEKLAIRDIQDATDLIKPVYTESKKRDGYVSLEVSPTLARDTEGTLEEARRLWKEVGRENVMIKVPAASEGIPAIQQLISEGINVNVTLLFAVGPYEEVAEAYISGLEKRAAAGHDISGVASVASFFISRIDSAMDKILGEKLKASTDPSEQGMLRGIMGKVGISNAKLTYQRYQKFFTGPRWQALADKGAQTQRLLWASTSTKNPSFRDVIYVEELIGQDTVDTIPPATYDAFRDHGRLAPRLTQNLDLAHDVMETLVKVGVPVAQVMNTLLDEGLKLFEDAFAKLLGAVESHGSGETSPNIDRLTYTLPADLGAAVKTTLDEWNKGNKLRQLWARDPKLWTGQDEGQWLGWLGIIEDQLAHSKHLKDIGQEIASAGFSDALLLGMGGSSLCPEVMTMTFGDIAGHPKLHVLDSTDPAQIKEIEGKVNLANTVFIVSSKSGGTLEPNIFKQYFFQRATEVVGAEEAPKRFIAITDPGSKMQHTAESDGFRHIFFGLSSIGGRYSALSDFGMVPASIMGVDVPKFLDRAEEMAHACSSSVPVAENPGLILGAIMGVLANHGRDKVTLIASPAIWDLGAWLEQLLAESTGKEGHGLIPVDRELPGAPEVYGNDRLFAYLRLETAPDAAQDAAVAALEKAGQPVVRIAVKDVYDLGQEFFMWEIATAVAGSIIGINAFNQPDVEAAKVATRDLTSAYEKTGSLPPETPVLDVDGVKLFTDEANAAAIKQGAGSDASLAGYLGAYLKRLGASDYFALLAFIQMNQKHEDQLQLIRHAVRDKKKTATCLGFGPRFLHSTGQAYKGGPGSGVFLQVTADDAVDLPVPGQKYTFGVVKAAQARGDFQVLSDRKRRALRVHLGSDVSAGLATLETAIKKALG